MKYHTYLQPYLNRTLWRSTQTYLMGRRSGSTIQGSLKRTLEEQPQVSNKVRKILNAQRVSDTNLFQTVRENTIARKQLLSMPNFFNVRDQEGILFIDKTMYIEYLENYLENYRYILLRPSRFGKSALLSMLCAYYDVRYADIFEDLFGPLYIGKSPTHSRNSHLILGFTLSVIMTTGSITKMERSFHFHINRILKKFIQNYRVELGNPKEEKLIDTDASVSLVNVLDLVRNRHYTLFVAVDDYDAPANTYAFAEINTILKEKICDIEGFFKQAFFAPLKQGCGIISKYILTGIVPAFRQGLSPLDACVISGRELNGICGFTEGDVKAIFQCYLNKDEEETEGMIHNIRKLYNGYYFSDSGYNEHHLVYNPQQVFHYVTQVKSHGYFPPRTTIHYTKVLKSIADIGDFSVENLVNLMTSGSVKSEIVTEFGFVDLPDLGKKSSLTWSFLVYMGILTYGPDGTLRIPNEKTKSEFIRRISTYLRNQSMFLFRNLITSFEDTISVSSFNLMAGYPSDFAGLLQKFLQSRTLRSLQSDNEGVLQGVVELLLDKPNESIPELRLVIDGSKPYGEDRYGFVNIFIPPTTSNSGIRNSHGVVLELKYITLDGLLKGEENKGCFEYDDTDFEKLRKTLSEESSDSLFARRYTYRLKDDGKLVTKTIKEIMNGGREQAAKYIKTIAKGKPKNSSETGVLDDRIKIGTGLDTIQGYVIVGIGGSRVMFDCLDPLDTNYEYRKVY